MVQTSQHDQPARLPAVSQLALVQLFFLVAPDFVLAQIAGPRMIATRSPELSQACAEARDADAAEVALISTLKSLRVDSALQSESAHWQLLIDPSTRYLDRMAAAHRGGSRISPEQLTRLWKAYAELQTLPSGVNQSPCWFTELSSWSAQWPGAWERRAKVPTFGAVAAKPETCFVLGYKIALPQKAVDYPLDVNSRNSTPWLWQVKRAFAILLPKVRSHYADPRRYGPMSEVCLRWHPDDYFGKRLRVDVLSDGPQNALWVRTLMRLARDEAPDSGNFYAHGSGSAHLEELKHVAQIAILQQTTDFRIAEASANVLGNMATRDAYAHPVRTATSVLEVSRWALESNWDVHSRYYFLAFSICRMVPNPPFKPDSRLPANGPEEVKAVAAFEAWFNSERPRLAKESGRELARLNDLAAELNTGISVPVIAARPTRK